MKKIIFSVVMLAIIGVFAFANGDGEKESKYEIVFIPKLVGIPWFNAMADGLKDYAKEQGDIRVTVAGAPEADPAQQARILEDAIARKPDCIIVVPNDSKVLEPIMKKGMDAGIIMISQEAASMVNNNADIEFLIPENVGRDYIEALVRTAGKKGGYAIMVGGLTVESHNARADAMVVYQEKNYPDLYQVTSRLEGSESVDIARNKTLEIIQAYDDLLGILYVGSLGAIGGAIVLEEKNLTDKITIIGGSVPSQVVPYLEKGSVDANIISNPYRIGKDSAYIALQLLEKKQVSEINNLPEYGETTVDGKTIIFHAPSLVTPENAKSFGF